MSSHTTQKMVYVSEGTTNGVRHHVLETPDESKAIFHALNCWLTLGCNEISVKREWRTVDDVTKRETIEP